MQQSLTQKQRVPLWLVVPVLVLPGMPLTGTHMCGCRGTHRVLCCMLVQLLPAACYSVGTENVVVVCVPKADMIWAVGLLAELPVLYQTISLILCVAGCLRFASALAHQLLPMAPQLCP